MAEHPIDPRPNQQGGEVSPSGGAKVSAYPLSGATPRTPQTLHAFASDPLAPASSPEAAGSFATALGNLPPGWNRQSWGDLVTLEYGKSLKDYSNQTHG